MSRGNGRQKIFRDERDYERFLEGLEATVDKFGFPHARANPLGQTLFFVLRTICNAVVREKSSSQAGAKCRS